MLVRMDSPTPKGPGSPGAVHICTIIARNYLPAARVLAGSFNEIHPEGTVTVVVIDDVDNEVNDEPFDLLRPEDLLAKDEVHRMATIYDVTEFATSLKPWLLSHLLEAGHDSVLYLDPDICVYDSLGELAALARTSEAVLIPHARAPLPRDKKMTSESALLASGIYNLGFIGVGKRSTGFLSYWKERLSRECIKDPQNMRFVDQRWIDFVPGMFDTVIVRDPRFNVAYWNLHEREITQDGDRFSIEGRPLGFFHFSGYSPRARHMLSSHQVVRPRILLSESPALVNLCDQYADMLVAAGFPIEETKTEYGLNRAANGMRIDDHVRAIYRRWVLDWDAGDGPMPPDPFDPVGAKETLELLNAIVQNTVGPSRLTLYQATLYAFTPEIQPLFCDPQGSDFERFQSWLAEEAADGAMDPLLLPVPSGHDPYASAVKRPSFAPRYELESGINVAGYMNENHSIGELGRLALKTVSASGIPYRTLLYSTDGTESPALASEESSSPSFDLSVNLVVVNADQICDFASNAGDDFFNGRYTIGQWAWELEEFPKLWAGSFGLVDEVWAISDFGARAIGAQTDKPVFVVPPPIVKPESDPEIGRDELGIPSDRFVFLFCFDMNSVVARKNPVGLIEAYAKAFPSEGDPLLVLKTSNGDTNPMDIEMIRYASRSRSDVVLIDDATWTRKRLGSLMDSADCYVSLHKSEGFGLTMGESMALEKPVIATGYSGNLDFMTDENSFLVPFSYGSVPKGARPYRAGSRWAEPDLGVAAEHMRTVFTDRKRASDVAWRGRADVEQNHDVLSRVAVLSQRFAEIERLRPRHSKKRSEQRDEVTQMARRAVRRLKGGSDQLQGRIEAIHQRVRQTEGDQSSK